MADVRDLIPRPQLEHRSAQGLWFARFIAPIPATIADMAYVMLPQVDVDAKFGPCRWSPRTQEILTNVAEAPEAAHNILIGRLLLPVLGDEALVAFDNLRQVWIVQWWPA